MTNRIPELQQYLHDRGESARGDYSYLEKIGVDKAVAYIRANDMDRAKELLSKLVRVNVMYVTQNMFTGETIT